jgi:mono/diheme cytochrome c family protein
MNRLFPLLACISAPLIQTSLSGAEVVPPDHAARMTKGLELFRKDVAGILKEHCLKCHGGDKTKGDFDLATREGLLLGGSEGDAITPFAAVKSHMLKLMKHEDEPHMPENKPKLPDDVIAKVAEWIDLGAPYDAPLIAGKVVKDKSKVTDEDRKWWAFLPLQQQTPPQGSHAVDSFLAAKAADKSLKLSPEADKRTLIRRATLDLTGLPPTPEEVATFLADSSPTAWEKVIDRLLASPRYGERWARHWLDVARFAESSGFEHDYDRPHAYHYRDFVIRAANQDMPFDEFARLQIAGDEIAPEDPMAMMATGFLGAGVFPTQITANEVERTRYDAMDDMLATTGSAFLGLTIGCARCHDHKFDPIPEKDYYQMLTTFTKTVRSNVDLALDHADAQKSAQEHAKKTEALKLALANEDSAAKKRMEAWIATGTDIPKAAVQTLPLEKITSKGGATFTDLKDGSWLASGANPADDTYVLTATTQARGITGIKLEALTHDSFKSKGPGRAANGNFALSKISVTATPLKGGAPFEVKLSGAKATHQQNADSLSVASSLDDNKKSGWAVDAGGIGKDHAAAFIFAQPLDIEGGVRLSVTLEFFVNGAHCIGRPRLGVFSGAAPSLKLPTLPSSVASLETKLKAKTPLTKPESDTLFAWWREQDPEWNKARTKLAEHEKAPAIKTTPVMVCAEGYKPIVMHSQGAPFLEKTHILKRGDPNQKQGEATQAFLQVLTREPGIDRWKWTPPKGAKFTGQRRTFANWLTDAEYGGGTLMARVTVNRVWQQHFGRGIVPTSNDFGKTGMLPTHPELLEWLSGEFIKSGWKLKPIHRLLMTSAAYKQSCVPDAAKAAADPENTLFMRRIPRRLEGEAVRDSALAAAGVLDETMFGAGTLDEGSKRRSIYFRIKRSQLVNSMVVFDAPEPLNSQGSRPTTTVAPQALLLMNSPHVRNWAVAFARRLLKDTASAGDQIAPLVQRAYLIALSREPRPTELQAATSFIQNGLAEGKEKALADFCQTLLATNEFAYLN